MILYNIIVYIFIIYAIAVEVFHAGSMGTSHAPTGRKTPSSKARKSRPLKRLDKWPLGSSKAILGNRTHRFPQVVKKHV